MILSKFPTGVGRYNTVPNRILDFLNSPREALFKTEIQLFTTSFIRFQEVSVVYKCFPE